MSTYADQIAEAERMQRWGHVEEPKRMAAAEGASIHEGADVSAPEPAAPAVEPEEPASAEQSATEEQP